MAAAKVFGEVLLLLFLLLSFTPVASQPSANARVVTAKTWGLGVPIAGKFDASTGNAPPVTKMDTAALRRMPASGTPANERAATITAKLSAPDGAVGNGIADDAALIAASSSSTGFVLLPAGRTYRIRSSITIGTIVAQGGAMTIDAGATVLFGDVIGTDAAVIFKGRGRAVARSGRYSVGWYEGATLNAKWDFCRRAFVANARKVVVFPVPAPTDPAANIAANGTAVWRVTSPLTFDDPENNATVVQLAPFYGATFGMPSVVEFSPFNKTEDIYWTNGISVDAGGNADDAIRIHAGARLQFEGRSDLTRARRDGLNAVADLGVGSGRGLEEVRFDFLSATNNGRFGVNVEGTSTNTSYGLHIAYLFNNGAKGVFGRAAVSGGVLTGVTLDTYGPNGRAQVLSGFGYTGQIFSIASKSKAGSGYGATATPVMTGSRLAGLIVTAAGTGFIDGETVMVTSAEAVLRLGGATRATQIGRILENQDDNSNLVSVASAYMVAEATVAGSSQGLNIGPIQSVQGRRPALITRDTSGGVAAKHRLSIHSWRVPNPLYNGKAGFQLHLDWVDEASVYDAPADPPSTNVVTAAVGSTNIRFTGLAREWVTGNGDGFTFDGLRILYCEAMHSNTVISMPIEVRNVTVPLRPVTVIGLASGGGVPVHYRGLIVGDSSFSSSNGFGLIDGGEKSTQLKTSSAQLTGVTGEVGKVTVSINGGRIYLENRLASSLRVKLIL